MKAIQIFLAVALIGLVGLVGAQQDERLGKEDIQEERETETAAICLAGESSENDFRILIIILFKVEG